MEYLLGPLSFTARIESVVQGKNGNVNVHLSNSRFFPMSGGQLGDIGHIGDFPVLNTICDDRRRPIHIMRNSPSVGAEICCKVDKEYRRKNSVSHTGQHILSSVAVSLFQATTSSYTMGPELSTIELNAKLSMEDLLKIEEMSNSMITSCIPVHSTIINSEKELAQIPEVTRMNFKHIPFPMRLVYVENVDISPCCGTHVQNTGECGLLKIFDTEPSRDGIKVRFAVGERALAIINTKLGVLSSICRKLNTGFDSACNNIKNLTEQNKKLQAREKALAKMVLSTIHPIGSCNFQNTVFSIFNLIDLPALVQSEVTKLSSMNNTSSSIVFYREKEGTVIFISSLDNSAASAFAGYVLPLTKETDALFGGGKGRYSIRFKKSWKKDKVSAIIDQLPCVFMRN